MVIGGLYAVKNPKKHLAFPLRKCYIKGMDTLPYMYPENGSLGSLPAHKGTYYEMQKLQERHKEILRLLALGVSKKDIAASLGITNAMIRYVEGSVLGSEYLEFIRGEREEEAIDIQRSIDNLAAPAVDVIRQAIAGKMGVELTDPDTGKPKNVELPVKQEQRIKASQDILSRHSEGYSPRQRITGTIRHGHTHDLGMLISNVKEKAAQLNGAEVIDAEIVEPKKIESVEVSGD